MLGKAKDQVRLNLKPLGPEIRVEQTVTDRQRNDYILIVKKIYNAFMLKVRYHEEMCDNRV